MAEGLLATVVSGLTVSGLELVLKLQYLSRLEATARFDSLVLPILFVHLPFALLAGRFAYALGERIQGTDAVGLPSLSRRTVALLVVGYFVLVIAHVGYNLSTSQSEVAEREPSDERLTDGYGRMATDVSYARSVRGHRNPRRPAP